MTRINLLPWREERRKERLFQFLRLGGICAVAAVAIMGYVHFHMASLMLDQTERNQYLQGEIKQMEAKITKIKDLQKVKQNLLARMNIIQRLQKGRPLVVKMFDELVQVTPDGIYVNQIVQSPKGVSMDGMAQSNTQVSLLMRNVDASTVFTAPRLSVIQSKDKSGAYSSFKMDFDFKNVEPEIDEAPKKAPARGKGKPKGKAKRG